MRQQLVITAQHHDSKTTASILSEALSSSLFPVFSEITELEKALPSLIPASSREAKEVIQYLFSQGGKRIRPAIFFLACKLFKYEGVSRIPIGCVCEYVHSASLLHDDVVDCSKLRRNKPTTNSRWGDQVAVLVGDLIYSRASEMMAATGELELVATFARAIRLMSEGELIQLEHIGDYAVEEEDYFTILHYKTGVLLGASCRAAGILAHASADEKDAVEQFGQSVGIAFQLIDDALDYIGMREIFGKKNNTDLLEGKVTLPVILLRQKASPDELSLVKTILRKTALSSKDVLQITQLVKKYETAEETIQRAMEFTDNSISMLKKNFPPSSERDHLIDLAQKLVFRSQ